MPIGAKDMIDVLLVKKYATMKVDNPIVQSSMVNPEKMLSAINDYAQMNLAMINLKQNLQQTCIKAISGNIQYRKSRNLKRKVPVPPVQGQRQGQNQQQQGQPQQSMQQQGQQQAQEQIQYTPQQSPFLRQPLIQN